eukprot:TRINITY_DN6841_c0_g1_i14.p1 TRINITY_DN6841_c0_g1~~TRINITY_DN6841_c0_g1_i14.p1  ORF type:complete len:202 (-),score=39.36 TRINITY_DN6841_c0_g1_i14:63-668(-)
MAVGFTSVLFSCFAIVLAGFFFANNLYNGDMCDQIKEIVNTQNYQSYETGITHYLQCFLDESRVTIATQENELRMAQNQTITSLYYLRKSVQPDIKLDELCNNVPNALRNKEEILSGVEGQVLEKLNKIYSVMEELNRALIATVKLEKCAHIKGFAIEIEANLCSKSMRYNNFFNMPGMGLVAAAFLIISIAALNLSLIHI